MLKNPIASASTLRDGPTGLLSVRQAIEIHHPEARRPPAAASENADDRSRCRWAPLLLRVKRASSRRSL